jgi:hypothetical protein
MMNPVLPDIPANAGADVPFVEGLRTPASSSALTNGQAPNLPGNDAAGVISRGEYGMVPEAAG